MSKTVKIGIIVVIAGCLMGLGFATSGMFINHTIPTSVVQPASQPVQTQAPVKVTQPPSAKDVATQLNCKNFTSSDPGQSGMVIDAGTCMIGSTKYAIDTFASKTVRDAWLKAAEPYGVVPKWETSTSVTYLSTGN